MMRSIDRTTGNLQALDVAATAEAEIASTAEADVVSHHVTPHFLLLTPVHKEVARREANDLQHERLGHKDNSERHPPLT